MNVWSTAATIYPMITKTEMAENRPFPTMSKEEHMSMGSTILHEEFSKDLIDLIIHCLAYDPADRPSTAYVVKEIRNVLDIYDSISVGEEGTLIEVDGETIQPDGISDIRIPGAIIFEVKKLPVYRQPSPSSVPTET